MNYSLRKNDIEKMLEYIYLIVFAVYMGIAFLGSTMFEITWPTYIHKDLRAILLIVILLRIGYGNQYTIRDILMVAVIGIICVLFINRKGYEDICNIFLLVIGAKGISFKKIIQVYFFVSVMLLCITIYAAISGNIENLVYYQAGRRRRIAMGIVYPTNFSAHVFFISLCYLYIRREKISYVELGGIAIIGIVTYWLSDARLDFVCTFLAVGIFGYNKWRYGKGERIKQRYEINKIWSMLLALSPVLCASFMIVISTYYSVDNKFMVLLNKILNNRFIQSHKAIDLYGFSLWGQSIPSQGYGGDAELPTRYFFLDSSYVSILMRYGSLVLLCVLIIMICISFKARREQDNIMLWLIAIVSVQCMIEHHLMSAAYNPFLWAALANMKESGQSVNIRKFVRVKGKCS